jgi:hypothetical protein
LGAIQVRPSEIKVSFFPIVSQIFTLFRREPV